MSEAFEVIISGREAAPAARLLECLTNCGLLTERVTWAESGENVILTVAPAAPVAERSHFAKKKQYKVIG